MGRAFRLRKPSSRGWNVRFVRKLDFQRAAFSSNATNRLRVKSRRPETNGAPRADRYCIRLPSRFGNRATDDRSREGLNFVFKGRRPSRPPVAFDGQLEVEAWTDGGEYVACGRRKVEFERCVQAAAATSEPDASTAGSPGSGPTVTRYDRVSTCSSARSNPDATSSPTLPSLRRSCSC
jgi:hypothetical protein